MRFIPRVIFPLMGVALLLTGCGGAQSSPSDTPSGDPSVVETSAPPALEESTPTPTPEPTPTWIVATPADERPFSVPRPLARVMQSGDEGQDVQELQIRLRQARYLAVVDTTTRFGEQTRQAVVAFQTAAGLPASGVVDQATWDALLPLTHDPTEAEYANTDTGPWYVGPMHEGFIKELQHRLSQIGFYAAAVHGLYDQATADAISAYRHSVGLSPSGVMDERAFVKLKAQTRNPAYNELFDAPPARGEQQQALDERCLTGTVICISKQQRLLSFVRDGQVVFTRESRFGRPGYETPVGDYRIWYKNWETVSDIFGERTPMPYALFFNQDIAVHFSDNFADAGYEGGSHGCSQLRDYQAIKWLYDQVEVGTRVIVY